MLIVTCALITHNEFILAVQRSEKMKMPLKWEFPGGKLEKGESEQECLLREIKEELHLEIVTNAKLKEVIYDYPDFTIRLIPFLATIHTGKIQLTEHKTYRWVKKEELLHLDWAKADLPIVEEFLRLN